MTSTGGPARSLSRARGAAPSGSAAGPGRGGAGRMADRRAAAVRVAAGVRDGAAALPAAYGVVGPRGLCLPEAELGRRLGGATVMVTSATGCIGSTLMTQLARRNPGRPGRRRPRRHQRLAAPSGRPVPGGRRQGPRPHRPDHRSGQAQRHLPRRRAALARAGRGGRAPHGHHQRPRHPQRAGRGRGSGRGPGRVRADRKAPSSGWAPSPSPPTFNRRSNRSSCYSPTRAPGRVSSGCTRSPTSASQCA
jgi:hypothetical protein